MAAPPSPAPAGRSGEVERTIAARIRAPPRRAPAPARSPRRLRRGGAFSDDRLVRERGGQDAIDIAGGEQAAAEQHERPDPLAGRDRGAQKQPFRREAAARRQAHQRQAAEAEGQEGHRHRARGAGELRRCGRARAIRRGGRRPGTSRPWRRRGRAICIMPPLQPSAIQGCSARGRAERSGTGSRSGRCVE